MKRLLLFLFIIPDLVMAYCSEPSAPYGGPPSKPSAPYCVNEWNNTHTCDDWEIDSYNNSLRNYKSEVEDYVRKLNNYLRDAQDYVNCQVRNID